MPKCLTCTLHPSRCVFCDRQWIPYHLACSCDTPDCKSYKARCSAVRIPTELPLENPCSVRRNRKCIFPVPTVSCVWIVGLVLRPLWSGERGSRQEPRYSAAQLHYLHTGRVSQQFLSCRYLSFVHGGGGRSRSGSRSGSRSDCITDGGLSGGFVGGG